MSGASIAAEVAQALAEVAQDVGDGSFTVTLLTPAAQPENPWDAPAAAPNEIDMAALVQAFPADMIDGTLIRREDRRLLLPANGPEVTVNCKLRIGGKEYPILNVDTLAPSGVPLYYQAQVRL